MYVVMMQYEGKCDHEWRKRDVHTGRGAGGRIFTGKTKQGMKKRSVFFFKDSILFSPRPPKPYFHAHACLWSVVCFVSGIANSAFCLFFSLAISREVWGGGGRNGGKGGVGDVGM